MKAEPARRRPAFAAESALLPFRKRSLSSIPSADGIYLFLDERGRILYIGSSGEGHGLARRIEEQFNSSLWPEVTHFKWAVLGDPKASDRLCRNLVREFDPPFNRQVLVRGGYLVPHYL